MERLGYIVITLRTGEALKQVPAHLDMLTGAARPVSTFDRGPLDRAIGFHGDGFRAVSVFHARASLNVPGEQHVGYDDEEERLGMSRTYRVRLADPAASHKVVDRLRSLSCVESAAVQQLAITPSTSGALLDRPEEALAGRPSAEPTREEIRRPYELVRGPEALDAETGDQRVTVACVDSGVSLGHPELQRKLLAGYDCVDLGLGPVGRSMRLFGDSRGRDFSPLDDVGHGSQVAGIMCAQGWKLPRGLAGLALLLPIRVLAAARTSRTRPLVGVGALQDIDAGLKVAVDLGADVLNMSFGTAAHSLNEGDPLPHDAVVRYATSRGCVLVAAAGNSGQRERFYPAAQPDVIAVGSVSLDGRRSAFSTWGDHIDIAAPGEKIYSADRRGYRAASGTSFAAPFVSAAAALLVGRGRRKGRRPTPDAVRSALLAGARTLGGGVNPETGHGLLDVKAAIEHLDRQEKNGA